MSTRRSGGRIELLLASFAPPCRSDHETGILFAIVALCLAMAGIYGVMPYVAGQRSKEIGLRMALGASTGAILWLMLGRGLKLTAFGPAGGVFGALAATRLVSGLLFDVKPHDVATYSGVVAALARRPRMNRNSCRCSPRTCPPAGPHRSTRSSYFARS